MIFAGSLHSGRMDDPLFDAVERAQLSDLLAELGPEPPSCSPKSMDDLSAR